MRLRLGMLVVFRENVAFVIALRIFRRNVDWFVECRRFIERGGFAEQSGFVVSISSEAGIGERTAGRRDVLEEELAAFLHAFDKAQIGERGIRCHD